jgi:two-component system, cell cycle sensor histidine kinase and response regulator CckA
MASWIAANADFLAVAAFTLVGCCMLQLWLKKKTRHGLPVFIWISIPLVLIGGWCLTDRAGAAEQRRFQQVLEGLARLYVTEFERMGHAQLPSDVKPDNPLYLSLIEAQKRWLSASPSVHDIYTLRKLEDGRNIFLVDSETDYDRNGSFDGDRESRTPIGEVYDADDPGLERAFQGEANFEPEPITDRWGTWISALAPLRDGSGKIEAVLGVDFDAHDFQSAVAAGRGRVLGFLGLVQVLLLASAAVISLQRVQLTERQQAAQALADSEARFRQFMDNSPAVAFLKDSEGRVLYLNKTFERQFNRPLEQAIGKNDFELWPREVAEQLHQNDLAVLSSDKPVQLVEDVPNRDGTVRQWLSYKFPYYDAAGQRLLGGVSVDITDRVRLEEQLRQAQKLQSVGQLTAGVAHEFNNILTIINGYAGAMSGKKFQPEEVNEAAIQISSAVDSAARLVRHLLAFSRKQPMQCRNVEINDLVNGLGKILRRILGEHVSLQFTYCSKPLWVHADPAMVEQVLVNIALNARDAMPSGGRLSIGTGEREITDNDLSQDSEARCGNFALVTLEDSGTGMDHSTLGKIFEPFFTTKDVGKGTGLGLSSAYGVVKQHDGWIHVRSEPGKGSLFTICLPLIAPPEEVVEEKKNHVESKGGTETILLVEDNAGVRLTMRYLLRQCGYRVLEAASGVAALPVWQAHRDEIDLLLTDMVMPDGMSGQELAQRLQRERAELKVVLASGYSAEIIKRNVKGGFTLLQKPFERETLASTVRQALDAA